jgi:hypothetical protein
MIRHIFGTGFIGRRNVGHLVIGFERVSPRISCSCIRGKFFNYSINNAQVSTGVFSEDKKDEFFGTLERIYENHSKDYIKIIIGDMNAQAEKESEYYPITGKYNLHQENNEYGMRLVQFAAAYEMVIGSTVFPHKNVHKVTWKSPDGETYNLTDHILIDNRHISDLVDVRSYSGANMDSDQHLIVSRLQAQIPNIKKGRGSQIEKFDISVLSTQEGLKYYS